MSEPVTKATQAMNIYNYTVQELEASGKLAKGQLPVGTPDNIHSISNAFSNPAFDPNIFVSGLLNVIALRRVASKMYENPWSIAIRRKTRPGEVIQEIYYKMAEPYEFDLSKTVERENKLTLPEVLTAFHYINYRKQYPISVSRELMAFAFFTWEDVGDAIMNVINTMYTAANYDLYQALKYMIAMEVKRGRIKTIQTNDLVSGNAQNVAQDVIAVTGEMTELSPDFNFAGVPNFSTPDEQYIIGTHEFFAWNAVKVLATAFNMSETKFLQTKKLVTNAFSKIDVARLDKLFAEDPGYTSLSQDDLNSLDNIVAVIVDRDFFQCYQDIFEVTENYVGSGMARNYWLNVHYHLGVSPFENAVAFVTEPVAVSSVTVTPSALTITQGQSGKVSAVVKGTGFPDSRVTWSVNTNADKITIEPDGTISVASDCPTGAKTITATSVADKNKKGTATLTVN